MILICRRQRLFNSAAMALIALTSCVAALSSQAAEDKKPNIVIIRPTLTGSLTKV